MRPASHSPSHNSPSLLPPCHARTKRNLLLLSKHRYQSSKSKATISHSVWKFLGVEWLVNDPWFSVPLCSNDWRDEAEERCRSYWVDIYMISRLSFKVTVSINNYSRSLNMVYNSLVYSLAIRLCLSSPAGSVTTTLALSWGQHKTKRSVLSSSSPIVETLVLYSRAMAWQVWRGGRRRERERERERERHVVFLSLFLRIVNGTILSLEY